jgi:hypothetical protein
MRYFVHSHGNNFNQEQRNQHPSPDFDFDDFVEYNSFGESRDFLDDASAELNLNGNEILNWSDEDVISENGTDGSSSFVTATNEEWSTCTNNSSSSNFVNNISVQAEDLE